MDKTWKLIGGCNSEWKQQFTSPFAWNIRPWHHPLVQLVHTSSIQVSRVLLFFPRNNSGRGKASRPGIPNLHLQVASPQPKASCSNIKMTDFFLKKLWLTSLDLTLLWCTLLRSTCEFSDYFLKEMFFFLFWVGSYHFSLNRVVRAFTCTDVQHRCDQL